MNIIDLSGRNLLYNPDRHVLERRDTVGHRPGKPLRGAGSEDVRGEWLLKCLPVKTSAITLSASPYMPGKPDIYDQPAARSRSEELALRWGTDEHTAKAIIFALRQQGVRKLPDDAGRIFLHRTELPERLGNARMRYDGRSFGNVVYRPETGEWRSHKKSGLICRVSLRPLPREVKPYDPSSGRRLAGMLVNSVATLADALSAGGRIYTETGANLPGVVLLDPGGEGGEFRFDAAF